MVMLEKVTVSRYSTVEERQQALYQLYAQVLERQPYAYERRHLVKAEKEFLKDKIGVKRFLKILGTSSVYLDAFYHSSSNLKFLELCFKHFMGRAPKDDEEMRQYCDILMRDGATGLVTALIDSEEYRKQFGCFTVPYAYDPEYYASPKAYLETDLLNHEYIGQRGWALPTMVWHQLHLDCTAGVCAPSAAPARAPQAPATDMPFMPPAFDQETGLEAELKKLLAALDSPQGDQLAASLSDAQRARLRQALG
jgi:phycoerythrin-associated linker protein